MKRWSGRNLRFVVLQFAPFNILFTDPRTGQLRVHGLVGSLMGNVTAAMNMTYTVRGPTDGQYGMVIEKTKEIIGMPRTVLDGDGDITGPFPVHPVYSEKLHEMARVHDTYSTFSIVTGMKHQYINTPGSLTDAFDSLTWLLLLGSFALLLGVFVSYNWLVNRPRSMTLADTVFKWLFAMFAALLQEATSEKPSTLWFERCFQGLWLMMCTLLSYTFLGSMKANLIVLTPTLRIDDLHDVVEHPELTLFYGAKTPGENILSETRGEVGNRLRDHLRSNSEGITPFQNLHTDHVRDALGERRGAVMMEEKFMRVGISKWCVNSPYSFYIAKHPITSINICSFTSRKLPLELRQEMDMKIMWLQAFAVPFMREKELLQGHLGCLAGRDKKTSEAMRSIQLRDFDEINASLLVGLASSIFLFAVEKIMFRASKSSNRESSA